MMHLENMTGWGMGFWWIGGFVMMALFIWILFVLFRGTSENRFHQESPREILSKRFARGEISKEEYHSMLNNL
ncbi:SHOCT domain-containing protein [Candidatus Sulfidibacterium hydrothermale]|uniref:SHOCT domain-containing protein n=1 Tax=Candidatus Sulfidibacterium hydrothermale TaxID=2875962 RepID=UPI001F0AE008|nr:SHOCT domain-containing protein [Candidatus Sulfidibacterium hydrothermale]UBM61210.1 SHOCT domain-containing protein [Candidatus Sulfidibacterium hydrothermale]